jgi:methylase of polypeptide subunit release factors
MPELAVWASDISARALEIAGINAAKLLPENGINLVQGDLFEGFKASAFEPSQYPLHEGAGLDPAPDLIERLKATAFERSQYPLHEGAGLDPAPDSIEGFKASAFEPSQYSLNRRLREQLPDLIEPFNTPSPKRPSRFALITANPPYIPSGELASLPIEVQKEPMLALDGGREGLDIIARIITEAKKHLYPGGMLLLEADPRQTSTIRGILGDNGYTEIETFPDLAGRERIIGACWPYVENNGSRSGF